MLFNGKYLICLELKSVSSSNISFERNKEDKGVIHKYQLDSLKKFVKYHNVISGFLLDFRSSDNTYFIDIQSTLNMISQISKKSFNEEDLLQLCNPIKLEKKKLKINYRYDINKMFSDIAENIK